MAGRPVRGIHIDPRGPDSTIIARCAGGLSIITPELYLQTSFRFNADGRIASTREPRATRGPVFYLVRGTEGCAWAVRCDVPHPIARELGQIAADEPPTTDFRAPPAHAHRYRSLIDGEIDAGPAFHFPDALEPNEAVFVDDVRRLTRHFRDWREDEVEGRKPIAAIEKDASAISVCCCARRSDHAAEAGLETAPAFRGYGFGGRVTAAWGLAVRASGRIPLYSTSWHNTASLAVARKLGLMMYASTWSVNDALSHEPVQSR